MILVKTGLPLRYDAKRGFIPAKSLPVLFFIKNTY